MKDIYFKETLFPLGRRGENRNRAYVFFKNVDGFVISNSDSGVCPYCGTTIYEKGFSFANGKMRIELNGVSDGDPQERIGVVICDSQLFYDVPDCVYGYPEKSYVVMDIDHGRCTYQSEEYRGKFLQKGKCMNCGNLFVLNIDRGICSIGISEENSLFVKFVGKISPHSAVEPHLSYTISFRSNENCAYGDTFGFISQSLNKLESRLCRHTSLQEVRYGLQPSPDRRGRVALPQEIRRTAPIQPKGRGRVGEQLSLSPCCGLGGGGRGGALRQSNKAYPSSLSYTDQ